MSSPCATDCIINGPGQCTTALSLFVLVLDITSHNSISNANFKPKRAAHISEGTMPFRFWHYYLVHAMRWCEKMKIELRRRLNSLMLWILLNVCVIRKRERVCESSHVVATEKRESQRARIPITTIYIIHNKVCWQSQIMRRSPHMRTWYEIQRRCRAHFVVCWGINDLYNTSLHCV